MLTHRGLLPWSWHAIYSNVTMSQRAPAQAYPKGTYLGTSSLTGNVDLYGTDVPGVLMLNGKRVSGTKSGA